MESESLEEKVKRLTAEVAQLKAEKEPTPTVLVIVQRCESARLLVDNKDKWVHISRGLIVHVSFMKGATEALVAKAAKTVLSVPLVTDGVWGDGTAPCSVLDRCAKGQECGIMVVPQASLAAKVKGKTLSYRNQLDKELSHKYFEMFVAALCCATPEALQPPAKARKPENATPENPQTFFKTGGYSGKYSNYDERGVPTHDENGEEIKKSQSKKLERLYQQQVDKYQKYLVRMEGAARTSPMSRSDGYGTGYESDVSAMTEGRDQSQASGTEAKDDAPPVPPEPAPASSVHNGAPAPEADADAGPHAPPEAAPTAPAPDPVRSAPEAGDPVRKTGNKLLTVVSGTFGNRQGLHFAAECGPFTHHFAF